MGNSVNSPFSIRKATIARWYNWLLLALGAAIVGLALATAYIIPSESMERTLLVGDYLLINKLCFASFGTIQRNDVVVLYAPYEKISLERRTQLIKRCIAVAGDTLEIRQGQVFLNGQPSAIGGEPQMTYFLEVSSLSDAVQDALRAHGVVDNTEPDGIPAVSTNPETGRLGYLISCPDTVAAYFRRQPYTQALTVAGGSLPDGTLFPDLADFRVSGARSMALHHWQLDNYGPLMVPKKGQTITLTPANAAIYYKIVAQYEPNSDVSWKSGLIYQHGRLLTNYTIQQDYYFVLGDNRHNSEDSRFWGFMPKDHLVGKATLIWLSLDPYASLLHKVRWSRIGTFIN